MEESRNSILSLKCAVIPSVFSTSVYITTVLVQVIAQKLPFCI